ncbi:MAG: DNA repair protein RecN, partial [Coriobacteriales bacterium]
SGGELSRVMLALVSRVDFTGADTLVFDEVDAGIGGATANLVADRLVDLAREHQVVVVTHLPQIAVRADEHLLVSKQTDADGRPATTVRRLSDDERVTEIARMLSGTDAEVSREHARVLLEQAERAG